MSLTLISFVFFNSLFSLVAIIGNPIVTIPEFARQFAFGYGKGLNNFNILERFPYTSRHPSWLRIEYCFSLDFGSL
jgi:hypothetical protein